VLVLSENISPPAIGGLLIIDQKPVVPDVAVKLTVSPPQERIWSGPAKAAKQGLPEVSKATVVGCNWIWQPVVLSKPLKMALVVATQILHLFHLLFH
jgi:hypothetical protein